MCGPSIWDEYRALNQEVAGVSISQAEMQRTVHRALYDAVRGAGTHREEVEARRAWSAHIREHRQQAIEIKRQRAAERVK